MPEIIPIGGGKGGVGKSFIAASLGALIAGQYQKVLLIDLDLGGANLHTVMGIKAPATGLGEFLNRHAPTLGEVAVPTPLKNLSLISSSQCSMEIANLYYAQKVKLINAIRKLDYDYVLIDLGAGTNFNTLDFFLTSSQGLVITTPEPTAIENSFRFVKAVYLRLIKHVIKQHDFDPAVKAAVSNANSKINSSSGLIDWVKQSNPDMMDFLKERIARFEFKLLMNQLRKPSDGDLGDKINTVCNRHFYSPFDFVGNVNFDDRVHEAVYDKELFVNRFAGTDTAVELKSIAAQLARGDTVEAGQ